MTQRIESDLHDRAHCAVADARWHLKRRSVRVPTKHTRPSSAAKWPVNCVSVSTWRDTSQCGSMPTTLGRFSRLAINHIPNATDVTASLHYTRTDQSKITYVLSTYWICSPIILPVAILRWYKFVWKRAKDNVWYYRLLLRQKAAKHNMKKTTCWPKSKLI